MSNQIEIDNNIIKYLSTYSYKPNKVVDALITETKKLGEVAKMQISPEQGQFIELLVKITKAKNCLEIGRFTGLSTLFIAKGLQKNGKIFSVKDICINSINFMINFTQMFTSQSICSIDCCWITWSFFSYWKFFWFSNYNKCTSKNEFTR